MAKIRAQKLKGDERTSAFHQLQSWLDQAASLAQRFATEHNDDPFGYNETASVSLLCAAAVANGCVALAEFAQEKRAQTRGRPYVRGRWDMWMVTGGLHWGLEFKQTRDFSPLLLERTMAAACADANKINAGDVGKRLGGVIAAPRSDHEHYSRTCGNLEAFSAQCDYAWLIDVQDYDLRTYLFFREL